MTDSEEPTDPHWGEDTSQSSRPPQDSPDDTEARRCLWFFLGQGCSLPCGCALAVVLAMLSGGIAVGFVALRLL
jgi:hypothetical protein